MKQLADIELTEDLTKLTQGASKTRLARRNFTFDEFDEITASLMTNTALDERQQELFKLLNLAAAAVTKYPQAKAVKVVQRVFHCSAPTAAKWIGQALNFFGDVEALSLKAKRFLIEQRLWKMLEGADTDQQIRIMKVLADVSGVKNISEESKRIKSRIIVRRSTDPRFLEAERTDYE